MFPDTTDFSGYCPEETQRAIDNLKAAFNTLPSSEKALNNIKHRLGNAPCCVCFEPECVCKPR